MSYHIFLASTKIYRNFGVNIQTNLPYLHPSSPNTCGLIVLLRLTMKLVFDLTKENGQLKTWEQITHEFKIDKNLHFKWIQLVHAIPNQWEKTFS